MTTDTFRQLDKDGYVLVEDVLQSDQLKRVRGAFYRVEKETRNEWLKSGASDRSFTPYGMGPNAHVVFPLIDRDDVFVDLLEHPVTSGIARRMQGPDLMMIDNALQVRPAGSHGHRHWHRDTDIWKHDVNSWDDSDRTRWEQMRACDEPHYLIKIFFLIEDIGRNTAPFSVVPGSHRWPDPPDREGEPLDDMPGHVRITGPAGSAIIWNGCIWHTAMANTGTKARRLLLYNHAHFGTGPDAQHEACILKGKFRDRMLRQRSPFCRQLLGIERMG